MKKILIFSDYYLPGFKGGGPIVSLSNMVREITAFSFKIITRDHDLNSPPYPDIKRGKWNKIERAQVYYVTKKELNFFSLNSILNSVKFDLYYFNSIFSIFLTFLPLFLRKLKLIPSKPVIIAPRGVFFPGVWELKKFRKLVYISIFKLFNLHREIIWHASNKLEKLTIQSIFRNEMKIFIAPNLISSKLKGKFKKIRKEPGKLNILFMSRISWKKNLDYALNLLKFVKGEVKFEIYGPIEDKNYWKECKEIIENLPKNINVKYKGVYIKKDGYNIFQNNHVFLFPTKGENFGHVIFESLSEGCPVIISDQTPWKDLQKREIGWIFSLSNRSKFLDTLNKLIQMNNKEYQKILGNISTYVDNILVNNSNSLNNLVKLFKSSL